MRQPSAADLVGSDFTPEDFADDYPPVEVWPDCWPVVQLFLRCRTQWRVGFNGPTGLDYGIVFQLIDRAGYTGLDWMDALDEIQVMEVSALAQMRKEK